MTRPDASERGESRVPDIRTALPGPKAREVIARDRARVSTSYTRDYPFVIAKGRGAVVEDVDGNVFLDCTAGIAVASTGHSHPEVVKAITEQAQKFLHMSGTDFYYELQARLGEEVADIVPMAGPHRSFFSNSGTEANEAALKLAKFVTGRHNVIAFFGAFHGRSMGSLAQSFRCDASTMTWLVDRLEERGLVERRMLPADRRVKAVALTPAGIETKAELMDHFYQPPPELLSLDRSSLEAIRDALTEIRRSSPAPADAATRHREPA